MEGPLPKPEKWRAHALHVSFYVWYDGSMKGSIKEKTSITLSKEVLSGIDRIAGSKQSRSAFIDAVLRQYLRRRARAQIEARDREITNAYAKDTQVINIHNARRYIGDRLIRTAKPHRILDPAHGPLIAVKLNILTRKTLGGFETDLDSRVFGQDGKIMPGLYAAGEAAGFGGGGMHGYRALEGTFLGGCLFSGRNAGRAAAKAVL